MTKLSKYVRAIDYHDDLALYNTINHAVIQLPREAVKDGVIVADLDEDSLKVLHESCFLDETDQSVESNLSSFLINEKKLFISLELNLSCNLRCPYCYQAGTHDGKIIEDSTIDKLTDYVHKVYEKTSFEDLYVKILGGEPTLVWNKFMKVYNSLMSFCKSMNVRFHVLVDTNGTLIDGLLTLNRYDSLLLTVPLSYKKCHDKVRFDSKGNGTYDAIVENINVFHMKKPKTKIVIRYNIDDNNWSHFKEFLDDIGEKLTFKPLVSVNYTAELNDSRDFKNKMTYLDFVEWCSTKAIDDLVSSEIPVTISPIVSIEECQFRSKYSLKLFSDGTVGSCAMSFFDHDRLLIEEIVTNFSKKNIFSAKKEKQTIIADSQCMSCADIFICGGTSKLPCIKALNPNLCNEKRFSVDLNKFIQKYLSCVENGTRDLFVVFENGESYR